MAEDLSPDLPENEKTGHIYVNTLTDCSSSSLNFSYELSFTAVQFEWTNKYINK